MLELDVIRFESLLKYVHEHYDGIYHLYDSTERYIEALYDTDFESDNGLDEEENGYEEFQCIVFKRIADGSLFEVNYREIPVKVICDDDIVYG